MKLKPEERLPFIDLVIDTVCWELKVDKEKILYKSKGRKQPYSESYPRWVIMYIVKELRADIGYPVISDHMNLDNHSSAIKGVSMIKQMFLKDPARLQAEQIKDKVRENMNYVINRAEEIMIDMEIEDILNQVGI
jgi:chromosomal replication initiation ATPase DnaA